ncbi:MAG TPA: crosslink repair DNA glycosylase YcaQ family protein, partial [Chloroflexota bacterium]|nr:crosslink repair DNA glycosylase YcaQ family protein [Chloroflexota bacterium]
RKQERSPRRPIDVLDHLGVLQLDSVSVISRPQDMVPFSRIGAYDRAAMHRAVYAEKRGFEYWGHEASWLPMAEYRYFLPRMQRLKGSDWWSRRMEQNRELAQYVLDRIRAEGPLTSADFEDPRPQRGTWWDRKPAKQVLETLFASGDLMCAARTVGFARLYDFPERVLPAGLDTTDPGASVAHQYLLRRAVAAMGVATAREAADYYRLKPEEWKPAVQALLELRQLGAVSVDGWREVGLLVPEALSGPGTVPKHRPAFLSPFDNLIWQRDRTERMFGFHYRIEIYVPEPQRRYGYYVLPLLARGQLVGRADLKHDRQQDVLRVRGLWMEGAEPDEVATALQDLASHIGASGIDIERCEPAEYSEEITRLPH